MNGDQTVRFLPETRRSKSTKSGKAGLLTRSAGRAFPAGGQWQRVRQTTLLAVRRRELTAAGTVPDSHRIPVSPTGRSPVQEPCGAKIRKIFRRNGISLPEAARKAHFRAPKPPQSPKSRPREKKQIKNFARPRVWITFVCAGRAGLEKGPGLKKGPASRSAGSRSVPAPHSRNTEKPHIPTCSTSFQHATSASATTKS